MMVLNSLTFKQIAIVVIVALVIMIFLGFIFAQQIADFIEGAFIMFFLSVFAIVVLIAWLAVTRLPEMISS